MARTASDPLPLAWEGSRIYRENKTTTKFSAEGIEEFYLCAHKFFAQAVSSTQFHAREAIQPAFLPELREGACL
jgi:hypothetical protein